MFNTILEKIGVVSVFNDIYSNRRDIRVINSDLQEIEKEMITLNDLQDMITNYDVQNLITQNYVQMMITKKYIACAIKLLQLIFQDIKDNPEKLKKKLIFITFSHCYSCRCTIVGYSNCLCWKQVTKSNILC